MPVVASFMYRDGKRAEDLPLSPTPISFRDNEFAWIGLQAPTAEEMGVLQQAYSLHQLAVEDAVHSQQIPKVDVYGEQLFVVAKTAHLEGDKIAYGETALFVGRHHIISVRQGSARAHSQLRSQLEASPQLLQKGPDYVLHAISTSSSMAIFRSYRRSRTRSWRWKSTCLWPFLSAIRSVVYFACVDK